MTRLLSVLSVGGVVAAAAALLAPRSVGASPASSMASAVVHVQSADATYFGSTARDEGWSAALPPQKMKGRERRTYFPIAYVTDALTDPFGCTPRSVLEARAKNDSRNATIPTKPFVLLVDRGRCTFADKAAIAQSLGAAALIVTDTLAQVHNRTRAADATPEQRAMEFSCANGRAEVGGAVNLDDPEDPRWFAAVNPPRCNTTAACTSGLCVPTGHNRDVCCAWDLPDAMGFTSSALVPNPEDIAIPVVRVTIAAGNELKLLLSVAADTDVEMLVTIYKRDPPIMDPSQFLIWLVAIVTVLIGGYKGAAIERQWAQRALLHPGTPAPRAHGQQVDGAAPGMAVGAAAAAGAHDHLDDRDDEDHIEDDGGYETMEMTVYHAIGFVVFATIFLLILFYFNVVIVVIVLFAIGSVSCCFQVLWQPLFARLRFLQFRPFDQQPRDSNATMQTSGSATPRSANGVIAYLGAEYWTAGDMVAFAWSLAISVVWFIYRNRQHAWVLQDLFGVCLCVLFLRTIRLPNLKIASIMLVLVFVYDIFMVFISPYIFHESVMIKAATGGNQAAPTVGDGFCLRYPNDRAHKCIREQMPILLRLPKIIDWRDGQSMLGLGDIVLPGLLLVFCARYDYVTRGQLMGRVRPHLARLKSSHNLEAGELSEHQPPPTPELTNQGFAAAPRRGLFGIILWGYAIGLAVANAAVILMKQGQPALMYLVPSTLGTLVFVAWRRGILKKLWDGPEEFVCRTAMSLGQRDRGFTVEQVPGDPNLVLMPDGTPMSTYSRSEDTPKPMSPLHVDDQPPRHR